MPAQLAFLPSCTNIFISFASSSCSSPLSQSCVFYPSEQLQYSSQLPLRLGWTMLPTSNYCALEMSTVVIFKQDLAPCAWLYPCHFFLFGSGFWPCATCLAALGQVLGTVTLRETDMTCNLWINTVMIRLRAALKASL